MKKQARKMMSMSLAAALALTSMPISVFAEDTALKAPIVENVDKEEQPVVEEGTTTEEKPVVEEETTVEEQPVVEEETTAEEQPVVEEETVAGIENTETLVDNEVKEEEATETVINSKEALVEAIEAAEDGDTIVLGEGTIEIGNDFSINKQVNIVGAGKDKTILRGSIGWGQRVGNTSISNLTMEGTGLHYAINFCGAFNSTDGVIDGATFTVENCRFENYQYTIGVNSYVKNSELVLKNCKFENTGCAAAIQADAGNTVTATNTTINGGYAVQLFGGSGEDFYNDFYKSFDTTGDADLDAAKTPIAFVNATGTAEENGAALQAAVDDESKAVIYVTSGTYDVTNYADSQADRHHLMINRSNLTIIGKEGVVIEAHYMGSMNGNEQQTVLFAENAENVTIKNLNIEPIQGYDNKTVEIRGAKNITVEDCDITGPFYIGGPTTGKYTVKNNVINGSLSVANGAGNDMATDETATISGNKINSYLLITGTRNTGWDKNSIEKLPVLSDNDIKGDIYSANGIEHYVIVLYSDLKKENLPNEEEIQKLINGNNPDSGWSMISFTNGDPEGAENSYPYYTNCVGVACDPISVTDESGNVTSYLHFEDAVSNAKDGDTILLAPGTYDVGTLRILKRINIQGSGAENTILKGNLIYSVDAENETMSVSNVTLQADDTNNEKAIIWSMRYDPNHTGKLTNCTLNISDCIVKGYKYGVTLDTNANSCTLNVENTKFENIWCAISSKEDSVADITFEESTSDGEYVVQEFGTEDGGNSYYETIDDYKNKENGTSADEAGIYVSTSEQLQNALATAKAGDTIKIGAGEYELAANQWGGTPVNLIGAGVGKTIIKDALWRGGANGNVITGIETLSVEGITFVNEDGINNWSNVGLGFTNIDGCTITVKDCEFDGWQYGVHMNGANPGTTVNFENVDFNNTFIAMSAGISEGTGIGTIKNVKTTDGALAVQVFGNDDYHYYSVDAFNTARGSELTPAIENINNKNLVEGVDYEDVDGALKGYVVTEGESIQGAIDKLNSAKNIVVVAPGTYDEDVTFNDKSVTVKGSGEDTIFSGCFNTSNGGTTADAFKADQEVVIDGFAFTGDGLKVGDCSYSTVGSLTVRNCTMTFGENGEDTIDGYGSNKYNYFVKVSSVSPDAKVVLEDNVVTGNPPTLDGTNWIYPIQLWGVKDVTVTGNEILLGAESAEHPIDAINVSVMNDEANVTISDNIIENCKNGINVSTWKLNGTYEDTGAYTGNVTINDNELKNVTGDKISIGAIEKGYPDFDGNVSASGNIDEKGNAVVPEIVFTQNEGTTIGKVVINIISNGNILERHVVDKDSEFKLPDKLSKEGYRFMGWSSEEGTIYDENSKVTVTEDAEFTAVWVKNSSPESDDSSSSSSSSSSSGTTEDIEDEDTPLTGEVEELPFTDVNEEAWYKEAVKYVYENEMMSGITSTTFGPNVTTTRGMIVTILYRLEGEPAVEELAKFDDVTSDAYYAKAVAWASANGVVSGYNETTFGPNDTITREQFASILYRYAQLKGYEVTEKGDITVFTDATKVSAWAKEAVEWAVGSKLITGKGAGMLDPTGTATRAEAAQMLMNFCENK